MKIEVEPPSDFQMAQLVFSDMKQAQVKLGESAYTALVRTCCTHGRASEGLSIYRFIIAVKTFDLL